MINKKIPLNGDAPVWLIKLSSVIKMNKIAKYLFLEYLDDKKELASLYIELGKLYSNISKDKELECYQKGVTIFKNLEII